MAIFKNTDSPKTHELSDPRIEFWWDGFKSPPGWYARIITLADETVDASNQIWFRTNVSAFAENQPNLLSQVLQEDYPDLDVIWLDDA